MPEPGPLVRAFLRLLPKHERSALLAEMAELYAARIERRGRANADAWARREYRRLSLRVLSLRGLPGAALWPVRTPGALQDLGQGSFADVARDASFAVRQFRRAPAWTAAVIATLGLGIGAVGLVLSVADTVLLSPLPYPEPDRLVRLWETTESSPEFATSDLNFLDFRDRAGGFAALAATPIPFPSPTLVEDGAPVRLTGVQVTADMWDVLGAEAEAGRLFRREEVEGAEAARVVVLGRAFWEQRYGADPDVVGRTLDLDGVRWTVVGVLGSDAPLFDDPDVWLPFAPRLDYPRGDRRLEAYGRLLPGLTLEQAEAEVAGIAAALAQEFPEDNQGYGAQLESFREAFIGPEARRAVISLLGAVTLLLLLGCANVANLWIARATLRAREMGLRTALGAGRARILLQLVTESTLLAGVGALLGVGLAWAGIPLLQRLGPASLPRIQEVALDARVLGVTVGVALLAGVVCGLVPAFHGFRRDLYSVFRDGSGGGGGRGRIREALVVGQLALAVVLLVGAGLLLTSFHRLSTVDPGFEADRVVAVELSLPEDRYPEWSVELSTYYREVVERVNGIPRVRSAAAGAVNPFVGLRLTNTVGREEMTEQEQFLQIQWRVVTAQYFETMGIPVLSGRTFAPEDRDGDRTALVTRSFAERVWPGEEAVGKRFQWNQPGVWSARVVGVVEDIRDTELAADPLPTVFFHHERFPWPWMTLMVRTAADPTAVISDIREAIWSVDPAIPVPALTRLEQNLRAETAPARFSALLAALLAALALALAGTGVYGVIACSVADRTREFGVRMALGADRSGVLRSVLARGGRLMTFGLVAGVGIALPLAGFLRRILYDTAPANPGVLATVVLTLGLVGLAATALPALKATRVDPRQALRSE
jgi:predicted permease